MLGLAMVLGPVVAGLAIALLSLYAGAHGGLAAQGRVGGTLLVAGCVAMVLAVTLGISTVWWWRRLLARERRARRAERFLDQASQALFADLDYASTLRAIVELAVPTLADRAAVEILQEDGTLEQVALAHHDTAKLVVAGELRRRFPPRPSAPGVGAVVAHGVAELRSFVDESDRVARAECSEHLDLLRRMDAVSSLIVPIVAHGSVLGAIELHASRESGRRFTRADLRFAEELSRRAGLAIENARLYQFARRAVTAREDLLAMVSHDLRSPLGVIQLKAQMLEERIAQMEDPKALNIEVIQRAAKQMDSLVAALVDTSSLESGRFSLARRGCDVTCLVRDSVTMLRPLAEAKQVSLRFLRRDHRPTTMFADGDRIEQVVRNLIENAIKFTDAGGEIVIEVAVEDAADAPRVDPREVVVSVRDTGPGIAAADLPRVFDRHWQGAAHQGGAGLGLYIARSIIEAHGGRIWARSHPGLGSTFHFALPLEQRAKTDSRPRPLHTQPDAHSGADPAAPPRR